MWSSSRSRALERARAVAVAALLLAATVVHGAAAAADPTPAHVHKYFAAELAGEARLTWFGLHVYDARLYVPPDFDPLDPVRRPFALELTYARALEGKAIAETSRDEIARMGFGTETIRQRWFEQMLHIFPDVDRGLRIAGVNRPGRGVRFLVNGQDAGDIDDTEFARAFFAIWLDPRTRSPNVRAGLLPGLAPR
jgi:hypothetical protein